MNWAFFRKNIWLLTILAFLMGLPTFAEARHHKKHKHSHSSHKGHKNNSCKNLQRIEQILKNLNSQAPISINQKKIDSAGGNLILTQAGDYCVTENIVGTLVIGTDSICLDLCCHTLNANGAPNAIVANGHQALKVFNGRIINSTDAGILVTSYSAVELYDLEMSNHTLDAIWQNNSTDLNVHDVAFVNSNSGERALLFNTCNNISVNRCQATGFRSTIGAIIQLDSCNTASIQDVDVTNCTKSLAAPNNLLDMSADFVGVSDSSGIDFVHITVNNNTINNAAVADVSANFNAIGFVNSTSCSLDRCETSNNTDIGGGSNVIDQFLSINLCDSFRVTNHQANNNAVTEPIAPFVFVISAIDSTDVVFDGCQANSNFVQQMIVLPPGNFTELKGITSEFFTKQPDEIVMRNCQANFNSVGNGGSGRDIIINAGFVCGLNLEGAGVIDNCQANNNTMGGDEFNTSSLGIQIVLFTKNNTISNSSASNNTGGQIGRGAVLLFIGTDNVSNQTIHNCEFNSNSGYGIEIGLFPDIGAPQAAANIVITDCTLHSNSTAKHDAAGIVVSPNISAKNILIKGCQIYDTSSGILAAGINASNASNIVIEDTNIFNTTSKNAKGHGILFDTLADSKIIRTQLHGNQDSGVELVGNNSALSIIESLAIDNNIGFNFASGSTSSCSLVQDSRALNNANAGFKYGAALPLTVTFIGNEAQCNGTTDADNYAGLGGHINLQELKLSNGSLTSINPAGAGAAALGARFTNLRVVP